MVQGMWEKETEKVVETKGWKDPQRNEEKSR